MAIYLPRRWRHQPSGPCKIDWQHPLARNLTRFMWIDSGVPTECVTGASPGYDSIYASPSAAPLAVTPAGGAYTMGATGAVAYYMLINSWARAVSRLDGCMAFGTIFTSPIVSTVTRYPMSLRESSGTTSRWYITRSNDTLSYGFADAVAPRGAPAVPIEIGGVTTAALDWAPSGARFFVGGRQMGSYNKQCSSSPGSGAINSLVNDLPTANRRSEQQLLWAGMWSTALHPDLHQALAENPWQILRAQPRRIFFDLGAASPLPTLSLPGVTDIGTTSARPRVTVTY